MWKQEKISLEDIGIEGEYSIASIKDISSKKISHFEEKEGKVYTNKGYLRCILHIESKVAHGSYGNLYIAKRSTAGALQDTQHVLVKQPRLADMNLTHEAILQSIAHNVLEKEGLPHAIPRVYDVFRQGDTNGFSMEFIQGKGVLPFLQASRHTDLDFYLLIAQVSLLLWCLEHHLGLDHRDLKIDNLLIKEEACSYNIQIQDKTWTLVAPFRVVLLDFGFACLGSEEDPSRPILNLGDGVLPPMDPCPKEGRDLFQLLTSLLRTKEFNMYISNAVHSNIDAWLSLGKKSYGPLARRWSTENWTYLVASQRNFAIPNCCPTNILQTILPELRGYLYVK